MPVTFHMDGEIGVITLASPARRNALSTELVSAALGVLIGDDAARARALVLTGEGPAFCAGADIGDLLEAGWMEAHPKTVTPVQLFEAISREPRVIVAAVNGTALGGGFELALSCDLAVAAEDAVFSMPELGHGVIPNTGLARLSQLVGQRVAFEMVATGRRVPAGEALDRGIVNRVTSRQLLVSVAVELAAAIVSRSPPGALAAAKLNIRRHDPVDWVEVSASLQRLPGAEWQEGLRAFFERRRPDYETFWRQYAQRRSVQDF